MLAGGDTTRRRDILVNVMVVGEVQTGKAVLRSGARPGDILFVSGRLGEAELGLRLIRRNENGDSTAAIRSFGSISTRNRGWRWAAGCPKMA